MNRELFFHSAGDERSTPQAFFDRLNDEFHFTLDAAASAENAKCPTYFGFGGIADDALEQDWGGEGSIVWLNPPYSVAGAFIMKAREEANKGATVVMLLPARTDTKWWHRYVYNTAYTPVSHRKDWHDGVEVRFIAGRLSFGLKVPAAMRASIVRAFDSPDPEKDTIDKLIEQTGLPAMAIKGICADKPDDDLLSCAPFPSVVVIFRKPACSTREGLS